MPVLRSFQARIRPCFLQGHLSPAGVPSFLWPRTLTSGHFSYRRVALEMYRALERQHPTLARHIRVTDFTQPIDLFQR